MSRAKNVALVLLLVPLGLVVSAASASAAPGVAAESGRPEREGFTLGLGLGGGKLQLEKDTVEADENVGLSLRAGIGVGQSFLVQATLEGTRAGTSDDGSLDLGFAGISGTAYLFPRLFVSFGVGYAALAWSNPDGKVVDETDEAVGYLAGVGIELLQSTHVTLNLELRGFAAKLGDTTARGGNLLLGVQFF